MSPRTARRVAWAALGVLIGAYTLGAVLTPPAMRRDPGYGFAVWRSMRHGGPFNTLVEADPTDIARDRGDFIAWWTPGQYLIPGLLTESGLSLGRALVLTVLLASALGLWGWSRVYERLGFAESDILLACALIAMNRFFGYPFGVYTGGEVLLFAGAPFLVLTALWAARGHPIRVAALAVVLGAAFILKSAALVLGLALCMAFVRPAWRARSGWLLWPAAFLATCAFADWLYLSRGATPLTPAPDLVRHLTEQLLFAMAGPLLSALSIDDFLAWILPRPAWSYGLWVLLPIALAALAAYVWVWQRGARIGRYTELLATVLGVYILVFAVLIALGADVNAGTEARHFRSAGLLLLPGLVAAVRTTPWRPLRLGTAAVALLLSAYGLGSYASKWLYLHRLNAVGAQGFTQTEMNREALAWLHQADTTYPPGSVVFYLHSPELALEVPHQRVIIELAALETVDMLAAKRYSGRAAHVFLLLPETVAAHAQVIEGSFADYQGWTVETAGNMHIYSGIPR